MSLVKEWGRSFFPTGRVDALVMESQLYTQAILISETIRFSMSFFMANPAKD